MSLTTGFLTLASDFNSLFSELDTQRTRHQLSQNNTSITLGTKTQASTALTLQNQINDTFLKSKFVNTLTFNFENVSIGDIMTLEFNSQVQSAMSTLISACVNFSNNTSDRSPYNSSCSNNGNYSNNSTHRSGYSNTCSGNYGSQNTSNYSDRDSNNTSDYDTNKVQNSNKSSNGGQCRTNFYQYRGNNLGCYGDNVGNYPSNWSDNGNNTNRTANHSNRGAFSGTCSNHTGDNITDFGVRHSNDSTDYSQGSGICSGNYSNRTSNNGNFTNKGSNVPNINK